MEGMLEVSYIVLCENDARITLSLADLLENEKVARAIKSEFAKGLRNVSLASPDTAEVVIQTDKTVRTFRASKNDFADLLELAEEDARRNKRLKKGCEGVELVDITTPEA